MEHQTAKASKSIMTYGIIFGVVSVLLGVIMYVTNSYLDPHWSLAILGFFIFIVIIPMGIKAFKKENGGFLSVGEAIKVGVGIALIAGIISCAWSLLLSNVLVPDYYEQMADMQRTKMAEYAPNMTEAQLDDAMEMNANFSSPWITIAITLVTHMFLGLLVALVAGLVMKEKRPYDV
ncbi:MAG TPA: DUF4199 domain-containing protein [Salinimicrobium sp.]|nr:DUF4199 domain-containing protein [Salinimicrobium sp.]